MFCKIISNKWRVLHTSILVQPDFAIEIIKATCALYNFVRRRDEYRFGDTHTNNFDNISVRGTVTRGQVITEKFADYFSSPVESLTRLAKKYDRWRGNTYLSVDWFDVMASSRTYIPHCCRCFPSTPVGIFLATLRVYAAGYLICCPYGKMLNSTTING